MGSESLYTYYWQVGFNSVSDAFNFSLRPLINVPPDLIHLHSHGSLLKLSLWAFLWCRKQSDMISLYHVSYSIRKKKNSWNVMKRCMILIIIFTIWSFYRNWCKIKNFIVLLSSLLNHKFLLLKVALFLKRTIYCIWLVINLHQWLWRWI